MLFLTYGHKPLVQCASIKYAKHMQLDLFNRLPSRPFCKPHKEASALIRSRKRALEFPYIQLNHPAQTIWLTFDIDDTPYAGLRWEFAALPPPTISVLRNDRGDSAHLIYGLSIPIKHAAEETKSMRYLGQIEHAMELALGADPSYNGDFTKTPWHRDWRTLDGPGLYELTELAEYLPANLPEPVKRNGVLLEGGRNCSLFDSLRWWCYRHARDFKNSTYSAWYEAVNQRAMLLNCQFIRHAKGPLNAREVMHIGKSVAKWVWGRQRALDAAFSARQKRLSNLAHQKRWGHVPDTETIKEYQQS